MPLKLNVGASRKVTDNNYGSRGASVNVELELDSSLVAEPGKLQERIRQIFGLARTALAEELNGGNGPKPVAGNGHGSTPDAKQASQPRRPSTASQCKALHAIARSHNFDLNVILRERFHVARAEDLSIKEASKLIDDLKNNGRGGG